MAKASTSCFRLTLIVLAALVLTASAYADAIFLTGNNVMNPEDNVTETITGNGTRATPLIGKISDRPGVEVHVFTTTPNTTLTGATGSCCITSPEGLIHNFTVTTPGFGFTHVIFRIHPLPVNTNIDATAFACKPDMPVVGFCGDPVTVTEPIILPSNGYVTVDAVAGSGEVLEEITVNSASGFPQIAQIRFGTGSGLGIVPPLPVPIPLLVAAAG